MLGALHPAAFAQEHPTLAIGSPAPDFSLPGIDGRTHTLREYASAPILAIVFTCNHCPTAQLYETRLKKLTDDYASKGVKVVAIQPNDPTAIRLDELGYTDVSDSFEEMKIRAAYRHFTFAYLNDGETQSVSNAYGPKATPHVFVFDKERILRYEGRIDNNQRESLANIHDVRAALDAMIANKPVAVPHTPVFGCSTKWKSKISSAAQELAKIEAEPVRVDPVSAAGLKALRANGSGKVLLINFWATWCGPCVHEFPDFETTYRMFRHRDFDLVTVSTNMPDEGAGVLKELQKQHASSRNLQFDSTDTYALQAAFEPKWESGVPYTVVLSPDGKVIYQKEGEVDILVVRRVILGNLPDQSYVGHRAYWANKETHDPELHPDIGSRIGGPGR
jgi:peroxiredoxin